MRPGDAPDLPEGLVFYPDTEPGISRRKCGRGFAYRLPDGTTLDHGPLRSRCEALAVPPAYTDVWISPKENGHLQATGFDARSRKQYRYHPHWAEARAQIKYGSLPAFGRALPRLRRRVARDLAEEPGARAFALAAAVLLIDKLGLRVGNAAYTEQNGSYGALTLRRRHLKLTESGLQLSYVAKGGQKVRRRLTDAKLLRTLEAARDLPGAELLSWVDAEGVAHRLGSDTLNAYISDHTGGDFTAKSFRTWAGTLAAFEAREAGETTIRALSQAAADRLKNTPTIARGSYIHPDVIALTETDEMPEITPAQVSGLSAAERRLLAFLERR
ncbi:DNA topoisomerase IB [Celeribacter indicus]|uniref:DNA topoisomerase n=1 Tax=Celeribacter indicus TaxID=1208324 RepID=A0A0B5DWU1_9RHOB|nr:DNA topoisomerase IB [Celeribacter indicus]AJE47923.1 DNA topoisomerase [Celeribacter indicus]SDW27045.1 DNA topoisomerase-1 [Celeribacter indicus]